MTDHALYQSQSQMEKYSRSEEEKKLFYCEVCEVPCATGFDLKEHFKEENHKQKERDLLYGGFKVEELERIIKKVKCLKDYVDEPEREPLIGLECVVEFTYPGAAEPEYSCELCGSKSKLVPMIVHLNGLKHRKAYISKHFPFTVKTRSPQEDIFQFLRRMALEIERYRGLKMFRIESTMEKEPADSLSHEPSDSLKRSRWESDYHSEGMFDFDSDSENQVKKIEQANRAAEILSKVKPLNQGEAKAMQRAKDRAAALQSNAEIRDAGPLAMQRPFETGDKRKNENERRDQKHNLESRDGKHTGLKYYTLWGEDEWKKFFCGRSSAEKAAWLETFQKNHSSLNTTSGSRPWIQASTQKKEHTSRESGGAQKQRETERRAAAERRERRAEAERRDKLAEIEGRAKTERLKRHAEAEKHTIAEQIAKAKSVIESLTQVKPAATTTQNQQGQFYIGNNSAIVKVNEEKLALAKKVAERITKMNPNLSRPTAAAPAPPAVSQVTSTSTLRPWTAVPSFIGKLRAFQNKPIRSVKGSDPSVRQAIAEKLAQTNRSQSGGENGKGDLRQELWKPIGGINSSVLRQKPLPLQQAVPIPVTTPSLPDESVVYLLETFLNESLRQEDAGCVPGAAVNWNQDLSVQSQPPQFVGTPWNLASVARKEQIEQALGPAYMIQNQQVQRVTNSQFYDIPTSSLGSSFQNPLNFQTLKEPSSIFGSQTHNSVRLSSLGDSCIPGNFTGTQGGFFSEYNGANKGSYPSIRGDGPSSYGADYQRSSLYRNISGASANRTSDVASTNRYNLTSVGSTLQGCPGNWLSSNYSGQPPNKLPRNGDQGVCSSLGGSYKDGFGEMAHSRATPQKSTFHHW